MKREKVNTYLSIDLDYWYGFDFPYSFLDRVVRLNVPTVIELEHHYLVEHIEKFDNCNRIVNIDMHADLVGNVDYNRDDMECGNWGNFVSWQKDRKDSEFVWCYPENDCVVGRTNYEGMWCDVIPEDNPFFLKKPERVCGWNKVSRRKRCLIKQEENIIGVGICLSPEYLKNSTIVEEWCKILLEYAKKCKWKIGEEFSEDNLYELFRI